MRLTFKKKLLLVITFFLTGFIRLIILFVPFRLVARLMGVEGLETNYYNCKVDHLHKARVIGWAVGTVSCHTPWKSRCMVQALTAQLLLRFFGVPATLYLGVNKNKEGQLIAHAWLRSGAEIVTGADTMADFRAIVWYGSAKSAV